MIELMWPEQVQGVRMLATAWSTTPDAVIGTLVTQGLREHLTDEVIQVAADKDRKRMKKFLEHID